MSSGSVLRRPYGFATGASVARKAKADNPVRQAIEKAGGVAAVARLLRVRERTVERWKKAGRIRDAAMCFALERETGIPAASLAGISD